ncbi:patatin-like phospholipase family protein [Pseudobacteriovorax antillogorgiicola]|uniref:Patatin-like phospholipase n=1 Tax=Pseudobacteriovorax antillogorgiicola TaxID=1513793 RepID=A0A1Y6C8X8_9BACT|nr:patatin-like phospholipase family protein [Pseudobacteriovorax antillogorgiicola]TCS49082.1 patatin-like phospholipase [Pseudobacteriovorax antillogorgiicola]SMF52005.1 Patatin-like phospholipase [Pseudobacteriovorax antillogorgiicola]
MKTLDTNLSISFAGCAWLFPFHLGVLAELKNADLCPNTRFLGASSGALAAAMACLNLCPEEAMEIVIRFAKESTKRRFGACHSMTQFVRSGLEEMLPLDAWQQIEHRLFISATELPSLKNQMISSHDIDSNQDLIQAILSSCYIPIYYEVPAFFQGRLYIDGGISDNQPTIDRETILVRPTRGSDVDIYPRFKVPRQAYLVPDIPMMKRLYKEGQQMWKFYWRSRQPQEETQWKRAS